jgi:hypothetical protein
MSAHLVGEGDADRDRIIQAVNRMLRERFNVRHTTLQVEGANHPAYGGATSGDAACDPCVETPQSAPNTPSSGASPAETSAARGRTTGRSNT